MYGEKNVIFENIFQAASKISVKEEAEAFLIKQIREQSKSIEEKELRVMLEFSLRTFAIQSILATNSLDSDVMNRLLDFGICLIESKYLEPTVIFYLIEDLLDSQTIDSCKKLFTVVESKTEKFADKSFIEEKSRLLMLRSFLEFLRRLSKSDDPSFRGRILIFLANVFPLSDRSGLNIKGEYNLANVTEYENEATVKANSEISNEEPIDYTFYRTFWNLQRFFQKSNSLSSSNEWNEFISSLHLVLDSFIGNSGEDATQTDFNQQYFPKFLTSSKLLKLQLKDPNFRRQILIQILIVLKTLENPIKLSDELNDKQKALVTELIKKTHDILEKILPNDVKFVRAVDHTLIRESQWVNWKREGCKSFERPPLNLPSFKKRKLPSESKESNKKTKMGSEELSRLWSLSNDAEYLVSAESKHIPSLEEFLQPFKEQMNPNSGVDEEDKVKNDKVYNWRAFRLLAKQKLYSFSRIKNLGDVIELLENEKKSGGVSTEAKQSVQNEEQLLEDKISNLKQEDEEPMKEEELETKEKDEINEEDKISNLKQEDEEPMKEEEMSEAKDEEIEITDSKDPKNEEGEEREEGEQLEEDGNKKASEETEEGEMKETEDDSKRKHTQSKDIEEGEEKEEGEALE